MKFNKVKIETDNFWDDLLEGGYIKPEVVLKTKEDIDKVKNAIQILKEFKNSAEEKDIIEYF